MDEEKPRIEIEQIKMLTEPVEIDCDARLAALERYFPDDLEGECSKCGRPIFYRPTPPYLATFLCLECGKPMIDAMSAGEANIITTCEDLKELHDWLQKHKTKTT
jgi:hypothetical protein